MPTENLEISLLSIISLISFFVFLMISKFSHKIGNGVLLDTEFDKPQAFHTAETLRSGGLASIISLLIFFIFYYFFLQELLSKYISISLFVFFLGFLDDIKFNISPNLRLFLMTCVMFFLIVFFSITINGVDLYLLKEFISKSQILAYLFSLICFLFIINGANLVDGFNGLLAIHLIIISSILFFLNLNYGNESLALIIVAQIIVLVVFLVFNFPKAKMFMGDSGSYMFGSLTALNIIETNNQIPEISSFFFCIILFYLFFEVFFSFFRKIFLKKSPFKPDEKHLHMLSYKFLKSSMKFNDCNYINSLVINLIYLFLIIPGFFFIESKIISVFIFFFLLIFYLLFYTLLYNHEKNYK